MREEIRAPGRQKTPNYVCHEVNACWLPKHGPELLSGSSLLLGPSSSFLGSLFTLSDGCAQLSCTQGLPGTYTVQAKRMKSAVKVSIG